MSFLPPRDGDPPPTSIAERRAHPRRAVSPRLYVVLYGVNSDGILYDVSEGGAALDILGSQPEGEYIVVDFEMAEIGRQFEAKARITWRDAAGKKVGIHFVDLPEASRIQLKEWLLKKVSVEDAAQPAVIHDAAREVTLASAQPRPGSREPDSQTHNNIESGSERDSDRNGDKLVQSLIESFSKQKSDSSGRLLNAPPANLFASKQISFSQWNSRRWIALIVAACLALILVLGVVAYRSPARNVGINVSKVGQLPDAGGATETIRDAVHNSGAQPAVSADAATGGANEIDLPAPGIPPPVLSPLSKTPVGQPPCVNLGSTSDKIRIYLWSEKDTPAAITAAYASHLKAVLDVRIVNKAPYDLVLYVNGAAAGSKGSESGFIWSSRVFRPWYCGQALNLLEQTQVNESLHYVEGANLDRHVQSEVAYLILHTFEAIRKEHTK
jgi:PilZ domain